MSAQPDALRLADELEQFRNDATPGKWGKGMTTHETVATQADGSKYHVADFRHAADAAFVDMAHRQARGIAAELRRLHAENEAKDALLRQAWAVIRWQCFGECRTDGVHGLPTPSEIDAAIRQHLGQKGETG